MSELSNARRWGAAVAMLAAALGTLIAAAPLAHAAATCSVDFSVSNEHPAVGQDITLHWASSGADQLVASWTTASVPFTGTQVTTEQMPGPVAYQVTGLNSGAYCGGAVVNVVYAAVVAPSSQAPTTTAEPTSTSPSASSPSTSVPPTSATPSTSQVTYPAQSPTSGSSTPWYEQPITLLVLGLLCLAGSIALFNRERVRAVLVRRH